MRINFKIHKKNICISHIGNGLYQYTLFVDGYADPFGFFWVRLSKGEEKKIGLLIYAYVMPFARGLGVSEYILARLMEDCDIIISGKSTQEGINKMKKLGFIYDEKTDLWILNFKEK
jgi:GNAT superfamily N-acetyltransferase